MVFFFCNKIQQFKNMFFNILHADSVANSRPVSFDVSTPKEIDDMFDSITYNKVIKIKNFIFFYSF